MNTTSTPITRKKDTGEPGNKGEFGTTPKAASGLGLTNPPTPQFTATPGTEGYDLAMADARRKLDRAVTGYLNETKALGELIGIPDAPADDIVDTARGALRDDSLKPWQAKVAQTMLDRVAELQTEARYQRHLLHLGKQARAAHVADPADPADLDDPGMDRVLRRATSTVHGGG